MSETKVSAPAFALQIPRNRFSDAYCNMLAEDQQNNFGFVLKSRIPTNSSHPSPVFRYFVIILSVISDLRVNIAPTNRNVKKCRKSRVAPIAESTADSLTTASAQGSSTTSVVTELRDMKKMITDMQREHKSTSASLHLKIDEFEKQIR